MAIPTAWGEAQLWTVPLVGVILIEVFRLEGLRGKSVTKRFSDKNSKHKTYQIDFREHPDETIL